MEQQNQEPADEAVPLPLPDTLPLAVEKMFEEHPPRVGRSGKTREQFLHDRTMVPYKWARRVVERSLTPPE